jgi:hypothetical protein
MACSGTALPFIYKCELYCITTASYLIECDTAVGLNNVRFEVLTVVTVTMTSVILRRIDTSVYAGGDHNPAREPHVALARHRCGSRKIPLIIFGY